MTQHMMSNFRLSDESAAVVSDSEDSCVSASRSRSSSCGERPCMRRSSVTENGLLDSPILRPYRQLSSENLSLSIGEEEESEDADDSTSDENPVAIKAVSSSVRVAKTCDRPGITSAQLRFLPDLSKLPSNSVADESHRLFGKSNMNPIHLGLPYPIRKPCRPKPYRYDTDKESHVHHPHGSIIAEALCVALVTSEDTAEPLMF